MKLSDKIAQQIEDEILSGLLEEGSKMPPIREFSKSREISHVTAATVYKNLQNIGLLTSSQKGYIVLGNASGYVKDLYYKKIERAFSDILIANKKLGLTNEELFSHLHLLAQLGGENG